MAPFTTRTREQKRYWGRGRSLLWLGRYSGVTLADHLEDIWEGLVHLGLGGVDSNDVVAWLTRRGAELRHISQFSGGAL